MIIIILTGNYLNITQPQALYLLKDIFGDSVDLRFYNGRKRSFHPKAYTFKDVIDYRKRKYYKERLEKKNESL